MSCLKSIREDINQILAISEKHLKLNLRFKFKFIFNLITPILSILMPLIILRQLFSFNVSYGPWNEQNFLVFQFHAYNIFLISSIMNIYPGEFYNEKFWKTLPNLFIAPFNQFYLLLGIFIAHLIIISIPFVFILVLCYIYYPISILTLMFIILLYLLIALIFSGFGLIMGVFAISKENLMGVMEFISISILWFSCITYPFQIFPDFIQNIINLNPLYYIFDFLRLSWIDNDILFTILHNLPNFFIILVSVCIFPIIGLILFKYIFKKYGIVGY